MPYTEKYRLTFRDRHVSTPVNWRVDILDDQPVDFPVPYQLTASEQPLQFKRLNTSDSKNEFILGYECSITYEFTSNVGDPKPELFFEADERRYQVKVYKNDVLNYIGYIKPDNCSYDFKYEPYTVTLVAVDGFAFAKATNLNVYDGSGLLDYTKISIFDILMTRGLYQIFDTTIPLNVVNTLYPSNMADLPLFNGAYIHIDAFYDFITGPQSIWDVMEKLCKTFTSRIFFARGAIWFVRTQDLDQSTITIQQYLPSGVAEITEPGFIGTIGAVVGLSDGVPVDTFARVIMQSALKKAEFEVKFKSINQLLNFQWSLWNGVSFSDWELVGGIGSLQRFGSGTIDDPYQAGVNFYSTSTITNLAQLIGGFNTISPGDILEFVVPYNFFNSDIGTLTIYAFWNSPPGGFYVLSETGSWIFSNDLTAAISFKRGKNKSFGNFNIKSEPIPLRVPSGEIIPDNITIFIGLGSPLQQNTLDGVGGGVIKYGHVKAGIISISSQGVRILDINNDRFSKIQNKEQFNFIDTGEDGLSTTIFVDNGVNIDSPAEGWVSDKPGVFEADIERHMADAYIDQYAHSIYSWEGSLYGNSIEFFNIFTMDYLQNKKVMQLGDTYNVIDCTHDILLAEILPENGANVTYTEYDIEDTNE